MEMGEDSQNSTSVAERVKRYRDKRKQELSFREEERKQLEHYQNMRISAMSDKPLSPFKAAARERKRRSRELKRQGEIEGLAEQSKKSYRTHYVKKTVKNTYKTLPRSPAERAEVLAKLAEQALMKLEAQASRVQAEQEILNQNSQIEYQAKI